MSLRLLLERLRAGDVRSLARAISCAENQPGEVAGLLASLGGLPDRGLVVGITGPTGVGKSTLIKSLLEELLREDLRIAVLAVDPSSPFSGGALLGDRFRMVFPDVDPARLFIRSLSSRGNGGGLSRGIRASAHLLRAAGYDMILVETTGSGQCEIGVVRVADLVCVVLSEGFGDELQTMKSGLLEIADIFVVNKCDRPGTDRLHRDLQHHIAEAPQFNGASRMRPDIVLTDALSGQGVADLRRLISEYAGNADRRAALAAKRNRLRTYLAVNTVMDRLKGCVLERMTGSFDDQASLAECERQITSWIAEACQEQLNRKHGGQPER